MKKILSALALAAAVAMCIQPVIAQSDAEREALQRMLDSTHDMLMENHKLYPKLLPPPAPPIKLPPITIYQAPPDPFAPKTNAPPVTRLKQRCSNIGGSQVCFLGI